MEERINQDTGLTSKEEEELLAIDEGGEVAIDEEDEALLNEWCSPTTGLALKNTIDISQNLEEFDIDIAETVKENNYLKETEPRTSTPLKDQEVVNSSTSGETFPADGLSGLGGFKIPRTTTVTRSKSTQKRPDPRPDIEIIAELTTEPRKRALKKPKLDKKDSTKPEVEIEILEEGEISSLDEESSSQKNSAMGNQVSLPRVLRAVVDILEEGEIDSPPPPTEMVGRPDQRADPQEGEEANHSRGWRKNGGRGVKGQGRPYGPDRSVPPTSRGGSTTRHSDCQEPRRRPLSPFRERSVQSLPDVEKILCAGRPYHWRERGGSVTRGSLVTPKDFRPGFHPRRKELRSDGIVSQRENARAKERLEKLEKQRKEEPGRATKPADTRDRKDELGGSGGRKRRLEPAKDDRMGVRKALNELEEAGARYQQMLAAFAAKYDAIPEGLTPPKQQKEAEKPTDENETRPGPSRKALEVTEMGGDDDAVEVRGAEPDEDGTPSWVRASTTGEGPVFHFSPPLPVRRLPTHPDERVDLEVPVMGEQEAPPRNPVVPRQAEAQQILAVIPREREPEPQPLPNIIRLGGPRGGPPARIVAPRLNRVQPPAPDPLNRQGGRIGPPGTGSRATRERRWRRERAQRMESGLEEDH